MITTKRVYDPPEPTDGVRILVERLWPRGIKKENLHMQGWLKDLAPSTSLRNWFAHDPAKWGEFQRLYRIELDLHPEAWQPLLDTARQSNITLLYSTRDKEHNNAVVLQKFLDEHLAAKQ